MTSRTETVDTQTVRVKVLRCVWETGWSGAVRERPWPDRVFAETFQAANGWSVRDFWLRSSFGHVDVTFDVGPWQVLNGASHEALKDDRAAIIAAARRQAACDDVPLEGYRHVVAFVHEPPVDIGICDGDLVLDQHADDLARYRQVGHLIGFGRTHGADGRSAAPYCVMGGGDCRVAAATLVRHCPVFRASAGVVGPELPRTVTLTALSEATGNEPAVAVIPVTGRDRGEVIVEYRAASGDDRGVAPAVVVHSAGLGAADGAVRFEAAIDPRCGASWIVAGVRTTVLAAWPTGVTLELSADSP